MSKLYTVVKYCGSYKHGYTICGHFYNRENAEMYINNNKSDADFRIVEVESDIDYSKLDTTKLDPIEQPKVGSSWTDIIDSQIWDSVMNALSEHNRLVNSGLYTENEYKELCSFTHTFSCDYDGRIKWCQAHNVIEYRGRSEWSSFWYSSPVDHILTFYHPNGAEVFGYKDGKQTWHRSLGYIKNYEQFQKEITDPLHVLDNDPKFLGRTIDSKKLIGVADSPYVRPYIIELN